MLVMSEAGLSSAEKPAQEGLNMAAAGQPGRVPAGGLTAGRTEEVRTGSG
jgi:hypothetical protein